MTKQDAILQNKGTEAIWQSHDACRDALPAFDGMCLVDIGSNLLIIVAAENVSSFLCGVPQGTFGYDRFCNLNDLIIADVLNKK